MPAAETPQLLSNPSHGSECLPHVLYLSSKFQDLLLLLRCEIEEVTFDQILVVIHRGQKLGQPRGRVFQIAVVGDLRKLVEGVAEFFRTVEQGSAAPGHHLPLVFAATENSSIR